MQGRISDWKDDRGFGFITPDEGGLPVFFHISALGTGARRPTIGEAVTFDASITPEGKVRADQVRRIGIAAATEVMMSRRWILSVLALVFIGFLCIQTVRGVISPIVPMVYCGMSLLAFGFYGFDKMSAKHDVRRTKENTLHLLGLLGGWPGALLAQQTFRHKSSKWSFQIVFWLTMIVNCGILWGLLVWMGSPAG